MLTNKFAIRTAAVLLGIMECLACVCCPVLLVLYDKPACLDVWEAANDE
jgi:hypothetical protein